MEKKIEVDVKRKISSEEMISLFEKHGMKVEPVEAENMSPRLGMIYDRILNSK